MALHPDILVLQECENPEKLEKALSIYNPKQILWYGDNPHKGIAIINFTSFKIKVLKKHKPHFRYIWPCRLEMPISLDIYVVWAMPHKENKKSYVGQIWAAINHYRLRSDVDTMWIGDFNSHTQWDHTRAVGHHSDVVKYLKKKNIISLYHELNDLEHGNEKDPTLYMYRHKNKPYHMDYCFLSESMIKKDAQIEIGQAEDWLSYSDHMPLIISGIALAPRQLLH